LRMDAPQVGEHNRELLGELGYDEAAINELVAAAIISA